MGNHQVGPIFLMPTVAKSTSACQWSRMNKKTDFFLTFWKREKAKTSAINHLMAECNNCFMNKSWRVFRTVPFAVLCRKQNSCSVRWISLFAKKTQFIANSISFYGRNTSVFQMFTLANKLYHRKLKRQWYWTVIHCKPIQAEPAYITVA